MRKTLSLVLVAAVALGAPAAALAAPAGAPRQVQTSGGTITGTAKNARGEPLPNYRIRIRNSSTGAVAAETVSNASGGFSVSGLAPGDYIVEIVDSGNKVIGVTPAVAATSGSMTMVSVTGTALGAVAPAMSEGAGFSLFGLGTGASVGIIAAAGTAGVVGIVAAKHNGSSLTVPASPSK